MIGEGPNSYNRLRACLVCHVIKSLGEFILEGCNNCESFLNMKDNEVNARECTTDDFSGIVGTPSIVGGWVNDDERAVGVLYAINVSGELPEHILALLIELGMDYNG